MSFTLHDQTFAGLSTQEAQRRLQQEGFNELPSSRRRNVLLIIWGVITEPMLFFLLACGVIYLLLADHQEAYMLLASGLVVVGITFVQERKTERTLDALRDLSSPRALVLRDGTRMRIPGREVVRDDIIIVSEGDRVPADAVVLSAQSLTVDESLLTGESVPVRKSEWDGVSQCPRPGGDDLAFVYSGTVVVQGKAVCRVLATGLQTEMGTIGKSLQQLEMQVDTDIQRETFRLMAVVGGVGGVICIFVALVYGWETQSWLQGLLAGITLAISMLPEEFSVVLTIFFAIGAWRISKRNVLTRHFPAIERLGTATVLCSDKTGTITFNRMAVQQLRVGERTQVVASTDRVLPEEFHSLLEYGILASHRDPFDPMEKAFKELGDRCLRGTEHLHGDWTLLREYPLSSSLLAMSEVWQSPDQSAYVIAAKGAPEAIADLCHFSQEKLYHLEREVADMARDGLRVLAVASARFTSAPLPEQQHDFVFEFIGLIGLDDPVRPGVREAIKECEAAGIRVIMITGDHPETAQTVARRIGLRDGMMLTGPELDALSDAELSSRIGSVHVFARVIPEQKLRIVKALRENGDVVAMTGDGVNDAPALKAAHIGIAMGQRGTDVAREAADLVLLDDNFISIVSAIRLGRRIFDNLQKAMSYVIAVHIPIAGLGLIPVLFGYPILLTPVHIMFIEFIIDPACSIAFEMEPEERDIMQRPPRDPALPMLGRIRFVESFLQGVSILVASLLVFFIAQTQTANFDEVRALAFSTLVMGNLLLILTNRSWSRTIVESMVHMNRAAYGVVVSAVVFLIASVSIPFLQEIFRFTPLSMLQLGLCALIALASISWFEILKHYQRHWKM